MKSSILLLLTIGLLTRTALAQGGVALRSAGELAESLLRGAGTRAAETSARELAEFGGRKAVQEVLEAAEREGGEALMRQAIVQTEKHGVLALRALSGSPAAVIKALDGMPAELAEAALRGVANNPAAMQKLAGQFGREALEVAARHPGLAPRLGGSLGREGLEIATKLTTEQAAVLAKHADEIAKLSVAERSTVMSFLRESPAKAISWLQKNPRILVAGAVTTAVIAARKEIFGEGGQPGFIERVGAGLYAMVESPLRITLTILFTVLGAWLAWKLRGLFRPGRRA